jgi:hypothetical protein
MASICCMYSFWLAVQWCRIGSVKGIRWMCGCNGRVACTGLLVLSLFWGRMVFIGAQVLWGAIGVHCVTNALRGPWQGCCGGHWEVIGIGQAGPRALKAAAIRRVVLRLLAHPEASGKNGVPVIGRCS